MKFREHMPKQKASITWPGRTFLVLGSVAILVLTSFLVTVSGCAKTSVDRITGTPNNCDTTKMSYNRDILPIVQAYCYFCHGAGNTGFGGYASLDGYDALKYWAQQGYLVGVVTQSKGFNPMPYGKPKLDPCYINKIVAWVNQGEPQ